MSKKIIAKTAKTSTTGRSAEPAKPAEFKIVGELAGVLAGMTGTNWNIHISKHHVRTVTVTFSELQPTVSVVTK